MLHDIFYEMFERKEGRLGWKIHVATDTHDKVLKIIDSLDSDANESTKPVIKGTPMCVFNLFQFFYNKRCIHEE